MPNFTTVIGEELTDIFVSDFELVDRYVGNQLWNWGLNTSGQLGTNDRTHRSSPVQTVSGGINWKQVSTGTQFSAGIKTDGTLWLWGSGTLGILGDNTGASKSSPVQTVAGGTNWKQVSCGIQFNTAIKTDGTLWTWGINTFGQLGTNNITNTSSPVQTVAGGTNWKQVSGGNSYAAGIKTDGTLWLWGNNANGELGDNTTIHRSSPVQTVAGGTNWKQIACGEDHTAAIKTDGSLWLWGRNDYGQLGTNNITNTSSPVQTIAAGTNWKQVTCSYQHTAAIKTDGTLWLWGRNNIGQLGTNNITNTSSPVQTVASGTNWKQVSCGGFVSSAIKTDGTLWVWGENSTAGQLGDSTIIDKSSPVQTVAGGTNWKQTAVSAYNILAVTFTES